MKKKTIKLLMIIFVLVFIFSAYKIFDYYRSNREYDREAEELAELQEEIEKEIIIEYRKPTDENEELGETITEEELTILKVEKLQEVYPQVLGFVKVPGTNIDLPFVHGMDNRYYLDHNYKGEYHVFGAVFLEKDNKEDFSDQNTILYGHNIRSGKFFHELTYYQDPEFIKEAPIIEIHTNSGIDKYKIFAAYVADPLDNFRTPNYVAEELEEFLDRIEERNILETEIPEEIDNILTLQTCLDNNKRLVIHGKLIEDN